MYSNQRPKGQPQYSYPCQSKPIFLVSIATCLHFQTWSSYVLPPSISIVTASFAGCLIHASHCCVLTSPQIEPILPLDRCLASCPECLLLSRPHCPRALLRRLCRSRRACGQPPTRRYSYRTNLSRLRA